LVRSLTKIGQQKGSDFPNLNMATTMKKMFLTTALIAASGAAVIAETSAANSDHSGNESHGEQMAVGMPGIHSQTVRTVKVTMTETDDGKMIYTPSAMDFKQGEAIRFLVRNSGELDHEFILDTPGRNAMHKEIMATRIEVHNTPNSISLAPGKSGEIIWIFNNSGIFEVACLIPGHYESGMYAKVSVK
jgi:uncharacterized cupredoxin-like copper-binding protein